MLPSLKRTRALQWACNAGMYDGTPDRQPVGIYIENGRKLRSLKKVNSAKVNFGMQPQSVFVVTKTNIAKVLSVTEYEKEKESEVRFATQSAPMLVIDSKINSKLTRPSSGYTRNGVGILKNGQALFLYAATPVTFQQFAQLFVDRGCITAMYLDGAISNLLEKSQSMNDVCRCYGPFFGVLR